MCLNFSTIKKPRVYQIIIKQIQESVRRGELKPGDKLPSERDLAEQLSVSRSAVREAFSVLEASGLVDTLPGVGIFLKKDSNEELIDGLNNIIQQKGNKINILELLEVREGIEVQAACLASQRRTSSDLLNIKQAYESLERAVFEQRLGAVEDLNFHVAIVKASHNKMLLQIVKLFSKKFLQGIEEWRMEDMKIPMEQKISYDHEHFKIYQAIAESDSQGAKEAMQVHFENTKLSYIKLFNKS